MTKQSVTNASPGPRVLNVAVPSATKPGEQASEHFMLAPGQTEDLELFNADKDPVLRGLIASGDILIGEEGQTPELPAQRNAREAADFRAKNEALETQVTQLRGQLSDKQKRIADLEAQLAQKKGG
jgi:hypothetical protein